MKVTWNFIKKNTHFYINVDVWANELIALGANCFSNTLCEINYYEFNEPNRRLKITPIGKDTFFYISEVDSGLEGEIYTKEDNPEYFL